MVYHTAEVLGPKVARADPEIFTKAEIKAIKDLSSRCPLDLKMECREVLRLVSSDGDTRDSMLPVAMPTSSGGCGYEFC